MKHSENSWTIGRLIEWTQRFFASKGIEQPRLEAEILLAHSLGLERIDLYMHYNRAVSETARKSFRQLVQKRAGHIPSQYLTGCCEFMSLTFKVTPACLIPRPETEFLVEEAIRSTRQTASLENGAPKNAKGNPVIVDLCTGCGCVAIAVAVSLPRAQVLATDISPDAIAVAQMNAKAHGVETRVKFFHGDLFAPLSNYRSSVDIVLANPPYVSEGEFEGLMPEIRDNEPRQALVAGPVGTEVHHRIVAEAPGYLKPGGMLFMEIAANQGADVLKSIADAGCYKDATVLKDYFQNDRVVRAVRRKD